MIRSNPPHQRTGKKILVRRNKLVLPHTYIYKNGNENSKEGQIQRKDKIKGKERKFHL